MEEEKWLTFGVAALLAREYAADQRRFVDSLGRMLVSSLPSQTEILLQHGLFGLRRAAREVRVELGDYRYSLHDPGRGPLAARRALIKRGIVLRTDEMPVGTWIQELGDALQEYARQNQDAAEALRRFLE
jgi:hypothetical protein